MLTAYLPMLTKPFRIKLLVLFTVFCLMLITVTGALANTVHVYDNAHVLNASQVQSEAASLPNPIDIYTTNTFTGSTSDFDQRTIGHITGPSLIVIAIDTVHKHLSIDGGKSVPLSTNQYNSARDAFINSFRSNNDYTGATIAAIDSLKGSLSSSTTGTGTSSSTSAGGFFSTLFGTVCCVGLILLVIAAIIFAVFRRRRFGFGRQQGVPYQQPVYPYNQGYPPPQNYYGPGYNQGQGVNPWVAGGLGAAGGGFLGYELGKEAGEREAREQEQTGNVGNGDFGGGSSGDFGGGSSGDFGGGSGGDFGGGSGGDFGGGSGGDFGGGSSGNF
jgi:hypothetical protein